MPTLVLSLFLSGELNNFAGEMKMGTGASTAAVFIAANVASEQREMRITQCKDLVGRFDSTTTVTVEQAREYADCINILYPKEFRPEAILVLKAIFVIALIGMVVEGRRSWKSSYSGGQIGGTVVAGIFGFIVYPVAVLGVVGLLSGLYWLFT